jgi:hypothetical protein
MSDCTNKDMGQLLHDFELGMLPEEEKQQFVEHLYECDCCLGHAREFIDVSRIIKHDPDAKLVFEDIAGEQDTEASGGRQKKWPPFSKLLIAAVLVCVVGAPVYWFGMQDGAVQQLDLYPMRGEQDNVVYLEQGGTVNISFVCVNRKRGDVCQVIISSLDHDTVFVDQSFTDFNDRGKGEIAVDVDAFRLGHYLLSIVNPSREPPADRQEYFIRAE